MMSTMLSPPPPTANTHFSDLKLQIKNLETTIKGGLLAKTYIAKKKIRKLVKISSLFFYAVTGHFG